MGKKEYITHEKGTPLLLLNLQMTDLQVNRKENTTKLYAESLELKLKILNTYGNGRNLQRMA